MPYRAPFITEMDEPRFTDCQFCAGLMLVAEWTEGEAIHDRHGHRLAVLRRRDAGTAVQRRAPTAADAGGGEEPPGGPRGGQGSDHDSPVTGARGCGQSRRGGATMTNLTVASLLTEAGARTAARLVTTLVELLKDGVGFRAPTGFGSRARLRPERPALHPGRRGHGRRLARRGPRRLRGMADLRDERGRVALHDHAR